MFNIFKFIREKIFRKNPLKNIFGKENSEENKKSLLGFS